MTNSTIQLKALCLIPLFRFFWLQTILSFSVYHLYFPSALCLSTDLFSFLEHCFRFCRSLRSRPRVQIPVLQIAYTIVYDVWPATPLREHSRSNSLRYRKGVCWKGSQSPILRISGYFLWLYDFTLFHSTPTTNFFCPSRHLPSVPNQSPGIFYQSDKFLTKSQREFDRFIWNYFAYLLNHRGIQK